MPPDLPSTHESTLPAGGTSTTETRMLHVSQRRERVAALRTAMAPWWTESDESSPWILELGSGHGHFLTALAGRHRERRFLGVDFCRDRIRRAERKRQRSGLTNLHFLHAEAGEFLEALPGEMKFQQVFVLFPDPWPKRRHRKNRLVSPGFLDRVATLSAVGAEFFFRSDTLDYVEEVRAQLAQHARWRLLPERGLPLETETVFQARAQRFDSLTAVLVS